MTSSSQRLDVVVVGAGAAGIAAGRTLRRLGLSFLILEGRDRLGGRAHTDRCGTPYPLDLGCEWLHSADRNVLAGMAVEHGFTLDKSDPPWRRRSAQPGFGAAEQAAFGAEQEAFYARLEDAAAAVRRTGRDRPASELLDPAARWNGLTDAISTYYNGAPLDRVSVLDFDRYVDTDVNWRVRGGYGTMIAALGADLPVRRGCRVTGVDLAGHGVRVETAEGAVEAAAAIVTVPTTVLASGAICFAPSLDDHMQAAAHLPLGLADKVFFTLKDADAFEADTRLVGAPERRDSGSYTLCSGGGALLEGCLGGDYARDLEAGGLPAFVDAARSEITAALGRDMGASRTPVVATGWARDPLALGSYSHALPGHAEARAVLATAVDDRLLFAGEATSKHFFSTAHGAYEEGARAARALADIVQPASRLA